MDAKNIDALKQLLADFASPDNDDDCGDDPDALVAAPLRTLPRSGSAGVALDLPNDPADQ